MKISLKQNEIEAALCAYVTNQGINTEGKDITFDFTMGRKGAGLTVDVNIFAPAVKVGYVAEVTTTNVTSVANVDIPVVTVGSNDLGYSTSAPTTGSLFANG